MTSPPLPEPYVAPEQALDAALTLDATPVDTDRATIIRYLAARLRGHSIQAALTKAGLSEASLYALRRTSGAFRDLEARMAGAAHILGPVLARRVLGASAAGAALRLAHEAEEALQSRDRIRAAEAILDRTGVVPGRQVEVHQVTLHLEASRDNSCAVVIEEAGIATIGAGTAQEMRVDSADAHVPRPNLGVVIEGDTTIGVGTGQAPGVDSAEEGAAVTNLAAAGGLPPPAGSLRKTRGDRTNPPPGAKS